MIVYVSVKKMERERLEKLKQKAEKEKAQKEKENAGKVNRFLKYKVKFFIRNGLDN